MGDEPSPNYPDWTTIDLIRWKIVPEKLGGGRPFIQRFKNGWIRHNRSHIKRIAALNRIPPELLAGVAWIEVGGDPQFIDRIAYSVRSIDWSGPKWVDDHLTITKNPNQTSFGPVSMQLRTAARTLGLDLDAMTGEQKHLLIRWLETDVNNLALVGGHLRQLIQHDFPNATSSQLTAEQIRVVGARYNRGAGLSLESIKKNTSYGDFILNAWPRLTSLLGG